MQKEVAFTQRTLSTEEKQELEELELEYKSLANPKEPTKAEGIYMNKNFNDYKAKFPHLHVSAINDLLATKWKLEMTIADRQVYEELASAELAKFREANDAVYAKRQELSQKIHAIKFGENVADVIKPSGKLKFLSAFRVYRRFNINRVKEA